MIFSPTCFFKKYKHRSTAENVEKTHVDDFDIRPLLVTDRLIIFLVVVYAGIIVFNGLVWIPTLVLFSGFVKWFKWRQWFYQKRTSGEEILTLRILASMISLLSQSDSNKREKKISQEESDQPSLERTEHNYVNSSLTKSLRNAISYNCCPVVRVIDHDLASTFKEIPDQLLTTLWDRFAQFDCLGALLT